MINSISKNDLYDDRVNLIVKRILVVRGGPAGCSAAYSAAGLGAEVMIEECGTCG